MAKNAVLTAWWGLLLLFLAASALTAAEPEQKNNQEVGEVRRPLLRGIANVAEDIREVDEVVCQPKAYRTDVVIDEPVYLASYPGSGTAIAQHLIVALSGMPIRGHGGEQFYGPKEPYNYVAFATHFPAQFKDDGVDLAGALPRALILIRNPLDAIPSLASFQYEVSALDNTNGHHNVQAPLGYWTRWRDSHFERSLENWKKTLEYWFDHYDSTHRFLLPYESLVDPVSGPVYANFVAKFMNRPPSPAVGGKAAIEAQEVALTASHRTKCLWESIVPKDERNVMRAKTYVPPYTRDQLDKVSRVLLDLEKRRGMESMTPLLQGYQREVEKRRRNLVSSIIVEGV